MRDRNCIGLAATAWIVGLAALACDYLQPSPPLVISMRTLFGIATCTAIYVALIPKARALADAPQVQLYLLTRLVSRWVYILMYGLALARVSLNLYDTTLAIAPARPLDDFQFYIACIVVPLWVLRAIVLKVPFNAIRGLTSN